MKGFRNNYRINKLLIITTSLLLLIGLIQLFSSIHSAEDNDIGIFYRQLVWIGLGILAGFIGFLINPDRLIGYSRYIYLCTTILLISVLVLKRFNPATSRWLSVGPVNFQPSELAKISLVFYLSYLFTKRKPETLLDIIYPIAITLIPTILIVLQPDLGTAIVLPAIFFLMLIFASPPLYLVIGLIGVVTSLIFGILGLKPMLIYLGILLIIFLVLKTPKRSFLVLAGVNITICLSGPLVWNNLLKGYQKARILSFLNPTADPLGAGYNIIQSQIAVGSGKLLGKGFLNGSQTHLRFLPVQHTDFIFSVLAEEWGFIGGILTVVLFTILLIRIFQIAIRSHNKSLSLLTSGIFSLLFIHILINIGMSIGLMPVTGLPLPLFSYGGSFMIVVLFSLGLVLGIDYRRQFFR